MKTETLKIKAFNNPEIISWNIVGHLKDNHNISLKPGEFKLVYNSVIQTIRQLGENDLLKHDAETIING